MRRSLPDPGNRGFTLVEVSIVLALTGILLAAVYGFVRTIGFMQESGITRLMQQRTLKQVVEQVTGEVNNADSILTAGTDEVLLFSVDSPGEGPWIRFRFSGDSLIRDEGTVRALNPAGSSMIIDGLRRSGTDSSYIVLNPRPDGSGSYNVRFHLTRVMDYTSQDIQDESREEISFECSNRK